MKKSLLILLLLATASHTWATAEVFTWKEAGKTRIAVVDPDTRAAMGKDKVNHLALHGQDRNVRFYRTDTIRSRQIADSQPALLPVLRQGKDNRGPWMLPAGGVIVRTQDEAALKQWASQQGVALKNSPVAGYWILETAPGQAALQVSNRVQQLPGIETASPNWATARGKR
ncbi:MAG: hypothetical protein ACK4FZ_05430 [Vogesella sp.]|uniref:hypothetical protein n=1 Tax=Vogesella sp. TaxID=1904252 RepID=UPI00391B3E74